MPSSQALRAVVVLAALALALSAGAVHARAAAGWQTGALDLQTAWQVTQGSPGVVVAVVDSGVQADHPALGGRVLPGYDFVNHDADAADDNGHGTALAGIVASTCPRCRILPVKVLDNRAMGDFATIAAGVAWAADHGAQVINLSVGAIRAPDSLAAAVSGALAKGVIVVAAAGNDGRNEPFFPAQYPGVVSVAGIDENHARYGWSNFGSWVSVAAPGCTTSAWLGSGYTSDFCGTSTAAPFVAGVAGLAKAFRPTLSPGDFGAALAASATSLPDVATGHGGVDANGLLVALGAPVAAPAFSTLPAIVSAPRVGRRLVARLGQWSQTAAASAQWQRSLNGVSWRNLARGVSYTPIRSDVRYRLRVLVTAVNVRGVATAASPASAPVTGKR